MKLVTFGFDHKLMTGIWCSVVQLSLRKITLGIINMI